MKLMKRILSAVLIIAMVLSMGVTAFAKKSHKDGIVAMGGNLTDEQRTAVYAMFGIEEGSVQELRVTIDEERALLSGKISDEQIGSRSISCVYITETEKGGIVVSTQNINYCTEEMYAAAMATAGIENAYVKVAAPFAVSGTAALVGIYKAYEEMTGEELSEDAKEAAAEELVLTGELTEYLESEEATQLINELKKYLDKINAMSDEEIRDLINSTADELNIDISQIDIDRVITWLRRLAEMDIDVEKLLDTVESIRTTVEKISEANEKAQGFFSRLGNFFTKVGGFFGKLFGGKLKE